MTAPEREKLLALAARCEASEPDRELDAEVTIILLRECGVAANYTADEVLRTLPNLCLEYTASLDQAMTLIPDAYRLGTLTELESGGPRWAAKLFNRGAPGGLPSCGAASPALALTAACLRARALAQEPR